MLRLPTSFYARYGHCLPLKISVENKFGTRYPGQIYIDNQGKPFIHTETFEICRLYQIEQSMLVRLSYRSRGRFIIFVPPSSNYFDDYVYIETDTEGDSDEDYEMEHPRLINRHVDDRQVHPQMHFFDPYDPFLGDPDLEFARHVAANNQSFAAIYGEQHEVSMDDAPQTTSDDAFSN